MKYLIHMLAIAGIFLSSCNMPTSNTNTDASISTAAALTVEAALNSSAPLANATTQSEAIATATSTFSEPMISVGEVTNCRSGPGTNYERITQITPDEQVKVIGAFIPGYWIVSTSAGVCWVNAEFATPIGSMSVVPTVTAPATPTGNAPEGVSLQKWDVFCNYATNLADVTIRWSDESNETGYRVIRNGSDTFELPQDSTQFTETITLLSGQSVSYAVEAFNGVGTTSSKTIALYC